MTDQKLADELEKALTDEAYDGGMGALGPEEFTDYVRTLAVTAAEVADKERRGDEWEARAEAERRIGSRYTGDGGIEEASLVQLEIDRFVEGALWAEPSDAVIRNQGGWDMGLQSKSYPPDEAVAAALTAWNTTGGSDRVAMRAALRAASAVTEQGAGR